MSLCFSASTEFDDRHSLYLTVPYIDVISSLLGRSTTLWVRTSVIASQNMAPVPSVEDTSFPGVRNNTYCT